MTTKLIWGILGGAVLGAAFGYVGGNTGIGIASLLVLSPPGLGII